MAILWQHQSAGKKYRVTQAGRTVRLYRDDVCHSQWNSRNPFSGHLWDLFCLSLFHHEVKNVCVLGVGGGTVINALTTLFPDVNIVGVDVDKVHLYVAREFFSVSESCCLVHADVNKWLKKQKPQTYDVIIDDVFSEVTKMPVRAVESSVSWFEKLLSMLKEKGTLVTNFADKDEWRHGRKKLIQVADIDTYQCGLAQHVHCENQIVHISQRDLSIKQVRYQLQTSQHKSLARLLDSGVLQYRKVRI